MSRGGTATRLTWQIFRKSSGLAWVEKQEAGRKHIRLKSGVVVTTEPLRVSVSKTSIDTVKIIVAHAKRKGRKRVVITGGTARLGNAASRRICRCGLTLPQ